MTIVFKVSDNLKNKVIEYYQDKKKEKTPPYAIFQAMDGDTTITLYESGKLMFQGVSADIDANIWIDLEKIHNKRIINYDGTESKEKPKEDFMEVSTIGSDEVGTGDFFGPIVVTATYVSTKDFEFLKELGVRDSKKLNDDKIKEIAPLIMKKIPYVTTILDNKTYNSYHSKENNMNKAEDQVLSVGCASIISRYIFLQKMDELSDMVHIPLPKGAGKNVDKVAEEIKEEYGIEMLTNIAKMNFSNISRLD